MVGRRHRAITVAAFAATIACLAPSAASATALHGVKTITTTVTTECVQSGGINPPPPQIVDSTVSITVPRHVTSGSTFSVHLSVPFTVHDVAEGGTAAVSGGSLASPDPGFVNVPAPSASITGDFAFTAAGPPGSRILWRLSEFGEFTSFPVLITYMCTPVRPYVLARTPIR